MMGLIASRPGRLLALILVLVSPDVLAQQLCQPVADAIRDGTGILRAAPAERLTQKEAIARATGALQASPQLVQALTKLTQYSGSADLYRFGRSELGAAVTVDGSAGCQFFAFYATKPDGSSDEVEPPAVLHDRPEGALMPCSGAGSLARIGEVGGVPAFVIEKDADQAEQITVTPWLGGAWQKACIVDVRYGATFTVTDLSCKDVDCAKVGDLARTLAMKFDRDPKSLPIAKISNPELSGSRNLPTFRPVIDHETFAPESIATPVTFDGQEYIARLGHRAIGWRYFPDYLFGLYRQVGDGIEPVAGITIEKKRDKPSEITVK